MMRHVFNKDQQTKACIYCLLASLVVVFIRKKSNWSSSTKWQM